MRPRELVLLVVVIVTTTALWKFSSTNVPERAKYIFGLRTAAKAITMRPSTFKCNLSQHCPIDHFAFRITSGAANVIGPRICFDGKIIMSHALNNVGPGLNIVLINGENGTIEKFGFLNLIGGDSNYILKYLKDIKPGTIVLMGSYDDVTKKMTEEMRELFAGMGSTLIKSVKHRDNWVFAGASGIVEKSPFEKHSVNDPKSNVYEQWPEVVEVAGCLPRKI